MHLTKLRLVALALALAVCFSLAGAGAALALQNHMLGARQDLNSALAQLNQAQPDKGGHRQHAIQLVNEAIHEVSLGLQYAQ